MTGNATPQEGNLLEFSDIYTGAITDVLFELGHGAQTLPHRIKALVGGQRMDGPAFTVEWAPYLARTAGEGHGERAWEMLSAVPAGSVLVAVSNIPERAVLGDLAMAYLLAHGCAGVVIDGGCRDVALNETIGLPTFCAFTTPQDASHGRGEVSRWGHEIAIGEVHVRTGDFVVADADGVVVIPEPLVDDVRGRASELVHRETRIRSALLAGESPSALFAS